jgi:hypothetical protein
MLLIIYCISGIFCNFAPLFGLRPKKAGARVGLRSEKLENNALYII